MQQLLDTVMQASAQLAVRMVSDGIRALPTPPPRGESLLQDLETRKQGCPVCRVHREVAEAFALVKGARETVDADGRIAQGVGGTIPLARKSLDDARDGLADVAVAYPELRSQIQEAHGAIGDARALIAGNVTGERLNEAASLAETAWRACHRLARAAFAPAEAEARDPLVDWYEGAQRRGLNSQAALRELKEVLRAT